MPRCLRTVGGLPRGLGLDDEYPLIACDDRQ